MSENEDLIERTETPRGFDQWGFIDAVRYRDGLRVEAYAWINGGVTWITKGKEPMRSGNCSLESFRSNYRPSPLNQRGL